MKAARLHEYGGKLVLDEVPKPEVEPGQVLVRVEAAGFCHSDLHVIDGELRVLPRLPLTLGHENAGTVASIGKGVKTVREGDRVAVYGGWGCGNCRSCISGNEQLCVATPEWVGLSKWDGGYAEYLLVPRERYLVPLAKLTPLVAAPLTDAALTPYRAVKKAQPFLSPDLMALVVGVGGLGQYGIKLLTLLGTSKIIAVDVSDAKLATARELGAEHAINARDPEAQQKILALTRGEGVGAAFDFVGSESSLALSLASTRTLGKVTQLGLAGGTARLKVLETTRFEVLFEATLWGNIQELREVIALAESGRLTPIHLESVPLDAINSVYDRLKRGAIEGRVVISPWANGS
jgi:propanol-preferring alcohol dehydrogenase